MCVLTEVSQAGKSSGLQRGVVGESPTGSHCDPLDSVQYQDVVVALYKITQNKRTLDWTDASNDLFELSLSTGKHISSSGWIKSKHYCIDSEDSLISQTALSSRTEQMKTYSKVIHWRCIWEFTSVVCKAFTMVQVNRACTLISNILKWEAAIYATCYTKRLE